MRVGRITITEASDQLKITERFFSSYQLLQEIDETIFRHSFIEEGFQNKQLHLDLAQTFVFNHILSGEFQTVMRQTKVIW